MKQYTCEECGGVFNKTLDDEVAEAEALEVFGVPNASTNPAMAEVCDDCYRVIMAGLRA